MAPRLALRAPSPGPASELRAAFRTYRFAKKLALDVLAHTLIPTWPTDAAVSLDEASDVLLIRSRTPWYFSPEAYAQESAFAHAMAERGRAFTITTDPQCLFGKSVVWFMPVDLVSPRLWDHTKQAQQFAAGLESQGNRVFCSSGETAYWENKVYMHQRLNDIGISTPETRFITSANWESAPFDIEPVLIKEEHSAGSIGIHHFATAREARQYVAEHSFKPSETLLMQEIVRGATRDLRLTMVGERLIASCSYWRIKSKEALSSPTWTSTATVYNSLVKHDNIPESAVVLAADFLRRLGVRTAGIDLIWTDDDLTRDPLVLEFSPYYQPNPPKPDRYEYMGYREWKKQRRFARDGYLATQFNTFRDIAVAILDQGLF